MSAREQTVFLVEDDAAVRKSIARALKVRGFQVETFESANAFLGTYEKGRPGCLLLDLNMPEMDGLALQNHMLEEDMTIPIIFLTGHGGVPESVQALKNGAFDFLEKPFRQEVLVARLNEALERDQSISQEREELSDLRERFGQLTGREADVVSLLVASSGAMSSKDIAAELGISHRTVDHYRAHVMEKTHSKSIAQLVTNANKIGFAGIGRTTDRMIEQS